MELGVDSGHAHNVGIGLAHVGRSDVRETAAGFGFEICCLAMSCGYAGRETRDKNVESTLRYTDLVADMGTHRLRVLAPAAPPSYRRRRVQCPALDPATCLWE